MVRSTRLTSGLTSDQRCSELLSIRPSPPPPTHLGEGGGAVSGEGEGEGEGEDVR